MESRESSLEEDREFAQIAGLYLNELIRRGMVTAGEVERADEGVMAEFVSRSYPELVDLSSSLGKGRGNTDLSKLYVPEKKIGRIRSLFSSDRVGEYVGPKRERIIEFAQLLLAELQRSGVKIEGLILFGSRMDEHKRPRPESDLDVVVVLEEMERGRLDYERNIWLQTRRGRGGEMYDEGVETQLWKQEESFWGTLDISARGCAARAGMMDMYEVEVVAEEIANESTLREALDLERRHTLPFWGWNPDAVYYVGRLGGMEETEVNDWLRSVLTSPLAGERRGRYMDLLKRTIRGGVRVWDSRLELV